MQDEKSRDLRAGEPRVPREIAVDLLDAFPHEPTDGLLAGEVRVAAVRQVAPLGPVAHGLQVYVDEGRRVCPPVAKSHRLLDEGEKLQLVLQVLRGKQRAVGQAPDVLGAVDDLDVPVFVEIPRIARVHPAIVFVAVVASGFLK